MCGNNANRKGINNPMWGRHLSLESKRKISIANSGANNGQWKGDNVGYYSLHEWMRRRLPKPSICQRCKQTKPYDLANISNEYKRDANDWWWLCRHCHMEGDGRLISLHSGNKRGL